MDKKRCDILTVFCGGFRSARGLFCVSPFAWLAVQEAAPPELILCEGALPGLRLGLILFEVFFANLIDRHFLPGPDGECCGALVEQHAHAVCSAAAVCLSLAQEPGLARIIDDIGDEQAVMETGGIRDGCRVSVRRHADGGGVGQKTAFADAVIYGCGIGHVGEAGLTGGLAVDRGHETFCLGPGTAAAADEVEDRDAVERCLDCDRCRGPAGAEQRHLTGGRIAAGFGHGSHVADAVRVVPDQLSILMFDCIDRADHPGRRCDLIQIWEDVLLVRHGEIEAEDVHFAQRLYDLAEIGVCGVKTEIDPVDSEQAEGLIVHHRGKTVGYRRTEQAAEARMACDLICHFNTSG